MPCTFGPFHVGYRTFGPFHVGYRTFGPFRPVVYRTYVPRLGLSRRPKPVSLALRDHDWWLR